MGAFFENLRGGIKIKRLFECLSERVVSPLVMRRFTFLITSALFLSTLPLPAWEKSVTTKKPGPHLRGRPVYLSFQVSWDGKINSAKVDFIFGKPDKRYPQYEIAQLYGRSSGVAKTLFPYKYNFTSFLQKSDYRPAIFSAIESDRDEVRETTNYYRRSVTSTEITKPFRKGKAPKTKKGTFTFTRAPVYDLLSAFIYIRSLDLKVGDEIVMVLHPFAGPYLARVRVLGREVHRGLKCFRLDLRIQKIGPKMNLIGFDKMKTATMWLSDDRERLPIELRTEVFIGDVRAILVGKKYL
jgi:hypothetical protein